MDYLACWQIQTEFWKKKICMSLGLRTQHISYYDAKQCPIFSEPFDV